MNQVSLQKLIKISHWEKRGTGKINSPSRYVFWFVAHERVLVVNGFAGAASSLRDYPIPADIELSAVVRVRKGRVRQRTSVQTEDLLDGAGEPVRERVCGTLCCCDNQVWGQILSTYLSYCCCNRSVCCPEARRRYSQCRRRSSQADRVVRGTDRRRSYRIYHRLRDLDAGSSRLRAGIRATVLPALE